MAEPDERHQLAGLDERDRGFNRPVEIHRGPAGWQASLRYETAVISSEPCAAQAEALPSLVALLQRRGYRQLKTQLSFQGGSYQGSRHEWVEYPDPEAEAAGAGRLRAWVRRWLGRS
jgi:hypothetical protein